MRYAVPTDFADLQKNLKKLVDAEVDFRKGFVELGSLLHVTIANYDAVRSEIQQKFKCVPEPRQEFDFPSRYEKAHQAGRLEEKRIDEPRRTPCQMVGK